MPTGVYVRTHVITPGARANMSKAQTGKSPSPETRKKISSSLMGHEVLPATRAKISQKSSVSLLGNTRCLGHRSSPETCAKQSASLIGRPGWNKGGTISTETKAKISAAGMGRPKSLETRKKMSVAFMGRIISPEARAKSSVSHMGQGAGRTLSPETRGKISVANWKGGRPVTMSKSRAKRRSMGYVFLNKWFAGCDGHHVDNEQVIHMPRELHRGRGLAHNHYTGKGMARMNVIAYNFLFKQEIASAIPDWPTEVEAGKSIAD